MSASDIHQRLLSTLSELDRVEKHAVLLFAEILARRLYRKLGYSSMRQYAREGLHFSDAKFFQFQRLAESFKTLPKVKRAVASGELSWTKARVLARAATPETENAWLNEAKKNSRRQLEAKVKAARASASRLPAPDLFEESTAPAVRVEQTMSLKLSPDQLAQFEILMEALRKQGLKGSREELLLQALAMASEADCTRVQSAPKQIVLYRCEDCGKTSVRTSRGLLEAEAPADCDAQVLGQDGVNRSTIPPAKRKRVLARDHHRCQSPGCGNTYFLEVHHIKPRAKGGDNNESNLTTLCSVCHRLLHKLSAQDCTPVQLPTHIR
jgi:hypothetical protein